MNEDERDRQVGALMVDMALAKTGGLPPWSVRKRLAVALVERGWRKADLADTYRELAERMDAQASDPPQPIPLRRVDGGALDPRNWG